MAGIAAIAGLASIDDDGDDSGSDAPAAVVAPTVPQPSPTPRPSRAFVVEAALATVTAPDGAEERWADERQAVVNEIALGGWTWDAAGERISGPAGMQVDLSECPSGWDPYAGIEALEIHLRQIASGDISTELGQTAAGMRAYFDFVNASGGLAASNGRTRRITVTPDLGGRVGDEGLRAADLEAFATQTVTGGAIDELAADLGSACVPDPFVPSSGPGWSDPAGRPWAWTDRLSPGSEGQIVADVVSRLLADATPQATVAVLAVDTDTGLAALQAVQRSMEDQGVGVRPQVVEQGGSESTATALDDLVAEPPDALVVVASRPEECVPMARAVREHGLPASIRFVVLASACRHNQVQAPPAAGDTTWLAVGSAHLGDGSRDEWRAWADEVLSVAGYPAPRSTALYEGFASGWSLHQALQIAELLPGGLSRPNLVLAARTMRIDHPGMAEGGGYGMYGNSDGDPVEAAPLLRWDSGPGRWRPSDLGVIDVSGRTRPCAWDTESRRCT